MWCRWHNILMTKDGIWVPRLKGLTVLACCASSPLQFQTFASQPRSTHLPNSSYCDYNCHNPLVVPRARDNPQNWFLMDRTS